MWQTCPFHTAAHKLQPELNAMCASPNPFSQCTRTPACAQMFAGVILNNRTGARNSQQAQWALEALRPWMRTAALTGHKKAKCDKLTETIKKNDGITLLKSQEN